MLLFLIPMCSCGLNYIGDKKLGTMERSRSAGKIYLRIKLI